MAYDRPVISNNVGRLSDKKAWRQNLQLAGISAAKVSSVLGPMGSYKMVTYNKGPEKVIKVTKDAVEVLNELEVQYPAVKTLAEAARIHREDVGDGVSTFVVIIAALLREADTLMARRVHPNVILRGYLSAAKEAIDVVKKNSTAGALTEDEALDMIDCGRDLITGKIRDGLKEAAKRARTQGEVDLKRIRILTKEGGATSDSKLIKGVVVRKERVHPSMKEEVHDARVAVIYKAFDIKPLELLMKGHGPFHIKLNVTDQGQIKKFRDEEVKMNDGLVAALKRNGVGVVFCRAKIKPHIADEMSREGILAFEMIGQADLDAVAEATGAIAVGDVMNLSETDLGRADRVWCEKFEKVDYAFVEAKRGSTLLLRGSSVEEIQELERVVKNAVRVLGRLDKENKTVLGGGAIYMQMAARLKTYALDFPGKEQMAIEAFANALEEVPSSLMTNFGLSYSKSLPELRSHHSNGEHSYGVTQGGIVDMHETRVRDMASTTRIVLSRAYEVASLLLRIDEYFYVKELPLVHKK